MAVTVKNETDRDIVVTVSQCDQKGGRYDVWYCPSSPPKCACGGTLGPADCYCAQRCTFHARPGRLGCACYGFGCCVCKPIRLDDLVKCQEQFIRREVQRRINQVVHHPSHKLRELIFALHWLRNQITDWATSPLYRETSQMIGAAIYACEALKNKLAYHNGWGGFWKDFTFDCEDWRVTDRGLITEREATEVKSAHSCVENCRVCGPKPKTEDTDVRTGAVRSHVRWILDLKENLALCGPEAVWVQEARDRGVRIGKDLFDMIRSKKIPQAGVGDLFCKLFVLDGQVWEVGVNGGLRKVHVEVDVLT